MMRPLTILFASVLFSTAMIGVSPPALAIPIAGSYNFSSPILNGTFTSDGSMLTDWNFTTTPASITFFNLTPDTAIFSNDPGRFEQFTTIPTSGRAPNIDIQWSATAQNDIFHLITVIDLGAVVGIGNDAGMVRRIPISADPIPEPSTMALVATGLLGLAGYRWYKRRHEGTQIG